MSAAPAEATQRLFFALWPQEQQRRALARAAARATRSCGGRPVPPPNLHVTLAFLGSVPQRRLPEVRALAQRTAGAFSPQAPLALRFESVAHWPRQQILCALAVESPAVARSLAEALKDAAAAAGFSPDLKPFHAHVTLARKVMHAPPRPALRAVVWRFDAFALLDSRTEPAGPVYSVIESYLLADTEKAHE